MGLGYGMGAGYGLSNSNGENQCQPLKQENRWVSHLRPSGYAVGLRVHVSNSSRRKTTYCWWRCLRKVAMRQKQTGAPLS